MTPRAPTNAASQLSSSPPLAAHVCGLSTSAALVSRILEGIKILRAALQKF